MLTNLEKSLNFIGNLEEFQSRLKSEPKWLTDDRQANFERFVRLGVPTIKDEEWKYTNVTSVFQKSYKISPDTRVKQPGRLKSYLDSKDINIVFVNGNFSQELSGIKGLPKGLTILNFADAIDDPQIGFESLLKKAQMDSENAFVSLNKALHKDGVLITIAQNTVVDKLVHIVHLTAEDGTVSFPRSFILAEKSGQAKILESHLSFAKESVYLANPLTDIFLKENASLKYCKAQDESFKAFHIGSTRVWQERNSSFHGFSLATGSLIARSNLDIILDGEGSSGILNGLYCIRQAQHVDNHTAVDHRQPNCTSNQLYKGILNEDSRAVFNGKIFVRSIAQKTNSYQLNKNVLLGTGCRVDTKPQLEIDADDVKCTHGATIGQLNEDEIFYLQTRCIPKKTAVKMLSRGFVNDILQTIEDEGICRKLNDLLEPTFSVL